MFFTWEYIKTFEWKCIVEPDQQSFAIVEKCNTCCLNSFDILVFKTINVLLFTRLEALKVLEKYFYFH